MKYLYWLINLRNSITELRQNYKYFLTNILKLIKSFLCTQHHDRCFGHYNTISEVVYWVLKYINKRLWSLTMKCLFLSYGYCVVVVPLLSSGWLFETPWTAAQQAPLSSTISWSLLKFMSIESVMLSNHLILYHLLLLLPSILPSINQGLFQWIGSSHQVAKILELQLQHQSF